MQLLAWDRITPVTDRAPITQLEIKRYCQTHLWVCMLEVIRGCVQFASASARTKGLHASTDPFPSQVCVEYPCKEALTQPNAPESPEIYNHHLHLPDITGTVSVTVSDRNLQGELSSHPPPHPPHRLWRAGARACAPERDAPLHFLKVIHLNAR